MELQNTPFMSEEEWREKKKKRDVPRSMRDELNLYNEVDELLPQDHEPQLVNRGGEHLVFELRDEKKSHDVVIKINFNETLPLYYARYNGDKEEEARLIEQMKLRMQGQKQKVARQRRYFGNNAVPVQQFMIRDIPVTDKVALLLEENFEDLPEDGILKIPAWVSVQRKLDLDPDRTISLNGHYQEMNLRPPVEPRDFEEYDEMHKLLVCGYERGLNENEKLEIISSAFEGMGNIAVMTEYDERFKVKLQGAVRELIGYVTETKDILDMNGTDNIDLCQTKEGWELKMPDTNLTRDISLDDLKRGAAVLEKGGRLDYETAINCYNAMNTVRVINALAIISGIPERLGLPYLKNIEPEAWRENLMQATY